MIDKEIAEENCVNLGKVKRSRSKKSKSSLAEAVRLSSKKKEINIEQLTATTLIPCVRINKVIAQS